jgi:SAM-dependent MidA family methyltransferase
MTILKARIVDLIEALGPISVAEYMALCLYDKTHGYYMTRDPLGGGGDFITAPEVSQMYGELIGAWIVDAWRALGAAKHIAIAEIGPGRGTLMKDLARTIARLAPELRASARFALVEVSPRLGWAQATTLKGTPGRFDWYKTVDELPKKLPLIIVGNELFDAVPIRQYVKTADGWRERMVDIDRDENLVFVAGPGSLDPSLLPDGAANAPEGAIVEIAPARSALMQRIAERIAERGAGLFIDYGYLKPTVGDTLQAMRNHAFADPLVEPGLADLTAHVDFSALAGTARSAGLRAELTTQGDFLLCLGLLQRAGRLGADADEATRERISSEVERLAGPDQMGTLFKVLSVRTERRKRPAVSNA